jgi:asparagine synthase (glutamine-hydrolysing)
MDSSMIVATMSQQEGGPFKTFAVGVEEQDFSELPYARLVADRYHTDHVEECVEADLIRLLPKMIWHMDEPSDPIAACQYYAAGLAARHVKVVLGGDGGDELFAGFDRYLGVHRLGTYTWIPALIREKVLGPMIAQIPDSFRYKSMTQKLRWVDQLSQLPTVAERYAEATCFFRYSHEDKRALYSDRLWNEVGHLNSADVIVKQFNRANATDSLDRMLYADFMTRLPEHSLMLTDRMTMAHGLEARSPYLDHELVEFMASFPSDMKIRGRELKYALRRLAQDYLPAEVVHRDKQGFMFPIAYWFRDDLYSFLEQFLMRSFFVTEGIFQEHAVRRMLEEHRRGRVDHHVRLWMLLNLEIWHQMAIRQRDFRSVSEDIALAI